MEYSPKKMQELLAKHDFNFKKMFGQNFIIDENIITNIIKKSEIDSTTCVLEIGPGAGSLTYQLSFFAHSVVAYEIDQNLKSILEETLIGRENVTIIYEDFLKANVLDTLKKYKYQKLYVVANLPYYITTPIIMKIIEEKIPVDKIVVMVQKEVGDRFKAKPGTKDYGSLSIYLDYYFEIKKLMDVSKNVFLPKPKVDSIVVEFRRRSTYLSVGNESFFFQLVRDSFRQKRKTIRNNLKEYDLDQLDMILKELGYDLSVRAEQLPIIVFAEISKRYQSVTKNNT